MIRVNVLHINRFFYSGQTTQVFSLVREQQKLGVQAKLIMDGYPTHQELEQYRHVIHEVKADIINHGDLQALMRHAQSVRPHLIHVHSSPSYSLAAKLAQHLRIPFVATCHGLGLNTKSFRPFLEAAQALMCISSRVAASLKDFSHKIHVIPPGIDLEDFKPKEKSEPAKIIFVAQIDAGKQKGYDHLCKAADLLDGVEFSVAANKPPNSHSAQYLGWPNKMSAYLSETDIVVGTGRAILEGMATENAAIILGRTYQGILTPEKIEKNKLPDTSGLSGSDPCYKNMFYDLAKLTQNRIYLQQLQQFGRKLAEKEFNQTSAAQRVIGIYASAGRD